MLEILTMCQAFEGEQNFLLAMDKSTRRRGYDAQKAGIPRDDNPEQDHNNPRYSDKVQWWYGWDTAAEGREPW